MGEGVAVAGRCGDVAFGVVNYSGKIGDKRTLVPCGDGSIRNERVNSGNVRYAKLHTR